MHEPVAQKDAVPGTGQLPVHSERLEGGPVPTGSGYLVVSPFKEGRIQFMGNGLTLTFFSQTPGTTGMVEMTMRDQKIFNLLLVDTARTYITQ